uniref:G protein-coupled receptor n=1 Tax=Globodera rostochiensis TaxID=31243 RepID=A0A914HNC2_GLORO
MSHFVFSVPSPGVNATNFWANFLSRFTSSSAVPFSPSSQYSRPFSAHPSEPAPLNLAIALLELLLDFLAPVPNLYFLHLLYARHDLHNNLRVLLGSLFICQITIALTRLPTQICYVCTGVLYIDHFRWLVFGHEIAVMFFRTIIVPMTVERVLATVLSKHYEQRESPIIAICAVFATLVLSTLIGLYIGSELNNSLISDGVITFRGAFYGLYHIIDVSVRLFIWIVCFTVFVTLLLYNQRCYAFARLPNKHSLVQRYQFAENVRSSRQLLAIGIIVFVCNLLFDLVMLRIAYNKDHFDVEYSQAFDFVLAVGLNLIPLAAIRFHDSMLSAAKAHCKQFWRFTMGKCRRQNRSATPAQRSPVIECESPTFASDTKRAKQRQKAPKALLSGQKLIFHRAEEQNVYFDELQKSWSGGQKHRRNTLGTNIRLEDSSDKNHRRHFHYLSGGRAPVLSSE